MYFVHTVVTPTNTFSWVAASLRSLCLPRIVGEADIRHATFSLPHTDLLFIARGQAGKIGTADFMAYLRSDGITPQGTLTRTYADATPTVRITESFTQHVPT